MDVRKAAEAARDYLVSIRREFHQHPELSMQEFRTAQRIEEELDRLGIPHTRVGETGVLGTLFSLFLVYSAGLRYLMMACALYAIGLPLLVVARRQRRPGVPLRQLFSHRGWVVLSLIVVLGVCGLVYTVHGGVFGVA